MSKEIIIEQLNEWVFGLETQAGEKLKVIDSTDFEEIATELVKKLTIPVVVSSAFADALYKETNTYLRRAKKNKNAPQMYIDDVFEMVENTKDIIDKKFN